MTSHKYFVIAVRRKKRRAAKKKKRRAIEMWQQIDGTCAAQRGVCVMQTRHRAKSRLLLCPPPLFMISPYDYRSDLWVSRRGSN